MLLSSLYFHHYRNMNGWKSTDRTVLTSSGMKNLRLGKYEVPEYDCHQKKEGL